MQFAGHMSYKNLVAHNEFSIAEWLKYPDGICEVMGSAPVGSTEITEHLLTSSFINPFPVAIHFIIFVSLFLFFLQKPKKQRGQSGYLLFSHEMRASIRKDHPEYAFGEISRIIGVEVISTKL